jgi:membrane protein involved in colicin uptake
MLAVAGLSNAAETTSTEKAATEKTAAEKKVTEKKAPAEKAVTEKKVTEKKTTDKKAATEKKVTEKKTEEIPGAISGKVVDTMDSGGYTYVQLENAGKKTWVAVPQTKVTKGKTMTFSPGMEMKDFESKTLKRKFDSIIFSGGVVQ